MTVSIYLVKWLQASVSCALAGLLVWAALQVAQRCWPALMPRRAVWLASQAVIAGAALLVLLPHAPQAAAGPAATREQHATPAMPHTTAVIRPAARLEAQAAAATLAKDNDGAFTIAAHRWLKRWSHVLRLLAAGWMAAYCAGLARAVWKLLRARQLWRELLSASRPLAPQQLSGHGAFSEQQLAELASAGLAVLETDTAISPLLVGLWRPRLLLPRHLRDFSREQQRMIIEHELNHWRRRDPWCLALSAALQTVFWFNPALRWLGGKLEWALELSCDQQVLAGRSQQERKQYAAALLMQWKAQAVTMPGAAMSFGGFDGAAVTARIRLMQQYSLPSLSRASVCVLSVLFATILIGGGMLQPALAFVGDSGAAAVAVVVKTAAAPSKTAATIPERPQTPATSTDGKTQAASADSKPPAVQDAPPQHWRYPLDKMRVTGFFGVQRDVLATPHRGIDIAAAKGTPVHAAAAGTVVAAGKIAEHDGRYGNTVIIEHGEQRSLYAHLSNIAVKVGDKVAGGQLIGAVGATGFTTGPHLHFEVRQGEQFIDPRTMLANLDSVATKRALKVRREQQGS